MIQCPHCKNSVDEKTRTTCPVCLVPLTPYGVPSAPTAPGYVPPPGTGSLPQVRPQQVSAPPAPYSPPPGSPYQPAPPAAYAPPPGSPYSLAPLPGAPPLPSNGAQSPTPGYGPPIHTRTTLTGEVVEAPAPAPVYPTASPQGGYTAPPGSVPYGVGTPYPARQATSGSSSGNGLNWKLAGGGGFTALYIVVRLILIIARTMHPATPYNDYNQMPQRSYYSTGAPTYPSNMPSAPTPYQNTMPTQTMPQPRVYIPPTGPTHVPFPSHFQRPNMPNMPNMPGPPPGFSRPNGFPGQGSFGMPPGAPAGNP